MRKGLKRFGPASSASTGVAGAACARAASSKSAAYVADFENWK
jgi:hypothetical protein